MKAAREEERKEGIKMERKKLIFQRESEGREQGSRDGGKGRKKRRTDVRKKESDKAKLIRNEGKTEAKRTERLQTGNSETQELTIAARC
jgi:hypothetical protein